MQRSFLPCALAGASIALALTTAHVSAQSAPELPAPSPKARVEQRVGLVDFSVDYSSPAVKGRKIWGGLVPYDRPWRTGANAATKLTASRDFVFAGKALPAGAYALYTIPGKATWTVVLSTSLDAWGNDGFDAAKDVARVTIKPQPIRGRERMTFFFSDTTDASTRLDLNGRSSHRDPDRGRHQGPGAGEHRQGARTTRGDRTSPRRATCSTAAATWTKRSAYATSRSRSRQRGGTTGCARKSWPRRAARRMPPPPHEQTLQLGTGDRVFEGFFKADVDQGARRLEKKS